MKFETIETGPAKAEMTPAERADLKQATEYFAGVMNLLPEKTPYDLQHRKEYSEVVKKLEEIAKELDYYKENEG